MNEQFRLEAAKPQRNKLDAYFTPPELTQALIDRWTWHRDHYFRQFRRPMITEPCAGDGWITRELESFADVTTGDIDPSREVDHKGLDFLNNKAVDEAFYAQDAIITNPPYSHAAPIARQALRVSRRVAMLLRITFLEGCEGDNKSARLDLLKGLARVIILPRVGFIHGGGGTDSVPSAWFIWEDDHEGPPQIEWVTKAELAQYAGQIALL